MRDENGRFITNEWNEIKFTSFDGAHRCKIMMERWLQNPGIDGAKIACKGIWHPHLDVNNPDHIQKMLVEGKLVRIVNLFFLLILFLGGKANENQTNVIAETVGNKLDLIRKVR
jgi:hypothetical protein